MFTHDSSIWIFILTNILTIFVVGVLYFIVKEIYRIRGNNVGSLGVMLIGSLIGVFILIIQLLISMRVTYLADYGIVGGIFHDDANLLYNSVELIPTIVVIIMFVSIIDNRLAFPLFLYQGIGIVIRISITDVSGLPSNSILWTYVLYEFVQYAMLVIILFFIPTINFIKKNGIVISISTTTMVIIGITLSALYYLSISSFIDGKHYEAQYFTYLILIQYGYVLLYSILQSVIILLIEKLYSNFSALETFSTKDDVSYYKMSLAQNSLVKMIDEEKINIGLLALFNIKSNTKREESLILEKIRIHTEDKYKNTFYFKASATYYGAFFQLSDDYKLEASLINNKKAERTEDDELHKITKEIKKICDEQSVKITASGSIYGIHSYSIPELIEHAKFLMSPVISRANSNQLIIYDFKRVKERLKETTMVRNLPVDIENMNISYLRGISSDDIFYPSITFKSESDNLSDIIIGDALRPEQKSILLRYVSYQTLRKFKNKNDKIITYYSASYLNSDEFKLNDFVKKASRHMNLDKVIIGINTNETKFDDLFISNVNSLKEKGIEFAAINPKTITQEEHDILKPKYILDPSVDVNPLRIKRIKIKINTDAILLNPNLIN